MTAEPLSLCHIPSVQLQHQDGASHRCRRCRPRERELTLPLAGFQGKAELLEVFSTEFQLRLLWGSRGAESSQAERYEKFDKVLTALSHKLEPAVRFSEL